MVAENVFIIISRLLLVFILSFIFGFERQRSNRPVGFGTFIFVSVGACGISMIALFLSPENVLIVIGSIVTGIGFLGAGALIKNTEKTFGFTTAASIWLFAVIGISVGLGNILLGLFIYVLVWIVVFFDRLFEVNGVGSYRSRITINTNKIVGEAEVWNFFRNIGIKKTKLMSFKIAKDKKKCSLIYFVEGDVRRIKEIPKEAKNHNWIDSFSID